MLARKKQKVPGFGHRVYRTEDPRATHLRRMSKEMLANGQREHPLVRDIAGGSRRVMKERETKIDANVDFYSASTYYLLGIPILAVHARSSPSAGSPAGPPTYSSSTRTTG